MDQIRTGAFIAAIRREKGMTQKELADILSISDRTVSRWETGNGMPEVSLMLPLCEELGITVNELLMAERIPETEKERSSDELMLELVTERENGRRKVVCALIMGGVTVGAGIMLLLSAALFDLTGSIRTFYSCLGAVVLAGGIFVCTVLDMNTGSFECPYCAHRFVPKASEYVKGAASFGKRYLRCPSCGKSGMCRRRTDR